tara:strand:- start:5867 stop:6286 length:420 start_codon:yes stop_codon:yes gene_type:complete
MRFADIFGKGLVGALTGIDLTDMVMKGGLVGAATGVNLANGGLLGAATGMKSPGLSSDGRFHDFLLRPGDNAGVENMPYYPGKDNGGLMQMPYKKGQRLHGIADFDGNYNPTYEIPGGPITPEEMQRMNQMYPIGNIGK